MAERSREISHNAFLRLQALQKAYLTAAERMVAGDDYPDFFVEGSGPPWHEMWPEVISGDRVKFSDDRLLFVDRLAMDDYPDFFVEGSGPPWHEMWPEVISAGELFDPANVHDRIRALKGLNVVAAFANLKARSGGQGGR